jgi:hypothetical protein
MKISDVKIQSFEYENTPECIENLFNINADEDGYYYFNLLKTVNFPSDLAENTFDWYRVKPNEPLTVISYNAYKTIKLWWVIAGANNIFDVTTPPKPGTLLKIVKPYYVSDIIQAISKES